jgi:aspartyl-tRNA(Asn)/glutamyl-tRNA(Gln) amidotransferase subunit B
VLADNADIVEEYRAADDAGRAKKVGALMGKAMGATKGQANPKLLRDLLERRLRG